MALINTTLLRLLILVMRISVKSSIPLAHEKNFCSAQIYIKKNYIWKRSIFSFVREKDQYLDLISLPVFGAIENKFSSINCLSLFLCKVSLTSVIPLITKYNQNYAQEKSSEKKSFLERAMRMTLFSQLINSSRRQIRFADFSKQHWVCHNFKCLK